MNLLKTALATTLVALLAACGNTKPTESTIEGLLEDALSQQLLIEGVVDIKDLEIVNGFEKEDGQYQQQLWHAPNKQGVAITDSISNFRGGHLGRCPCQT